MLRRGRERLRGCRAFGTELVVSVAQVTFGRYIIAYNLLHAVNWSLIHSLSLIGGVLNL